MELTYHPATAADAGLLIRLYNAAFYSDFAKYGVCPGYGKTQAQMEQSILDFPKFIICCDAIPVGVISCKETEPGVYEIGCLCVIPAYQRRGIGAKAVRFVRSYYNNWRKLTLITPADKEQNLRFYTETCGFSIQSTEQQNGIPLVRFVMER